MQRKHKTTVAVAASLSGVLIAGGLAASSSAATGASPEPVVTTAPPLAADGDLPNVVVLDGGGTITSTAVGRAEYTEYGGDGLESIQDVIDRIEPEISQVADLRVVDGAIPGSSASTTQRQLYDMTLQLDGILADDSVDAVVVNTGTNIMEEIAYWADLTVQSEKPVVFTGSMRQSNTFSFDGEANLFNAIRVAASGKTTCFGTVVHMNDEFVGAREMTKTDAWRTDTFSGGRYGALGTVDGRHIRAVHAPARVLDCGTDEWTTPFDLSTVAFEDLAQVEIVMSYVEADATPVTALAEAGVDGIVTAGHGAGGISTEQSAARSAAVEQGVVFATTTRTGSGAIYPSDPATPGVVAAYDLTPQKARVLLQLALTFTDDPQQVQQWFDTIGSPEFGG
ncbi:asparaginase [Kineococcus terrestris]|uniref:asparaginase n=1 Tax=Kineococcus terrestris TaxID=2044856 RepID=UPI0034DB4709